MWRDELELVICLYTFTNLNCITFHTSTTLILCRITNDSLLPFRPSAMLTYNNRLTCEFLMTMQVRTIWGNKLFEETNGFRWERNTLVWEQNADRFEQKSLMWERNGLNDVAVRFGVCNENTSDSEFTNYIWQLDRKALLYSTNKICRKGTNALLSLIFRHFRYGIAGDQKYTCSHVIRVSP